MPAVLAVDLGGTSLRAGLVTQTGEVIALAARMHRIDAEADAETWWTGLRELLGRLPLDDVVALGLTGFTRSQILVDADGRPVRPAQCFPDGRASQEAADLGDAADGTWSSVTPYHPLARLLWAQRHDPEAYARACHLLQPKDFLALRLTGRATADRIANAWAIDRMTGDRAAIVPALVPDLLDPCDCVGPVRGIPQLDGVPVFAGSMDTWSATFGAGAVRTGGGYIISGTTDAAGAFATAPIERTGRLTLPWGGGLFHTGGPSGAGADCAAWAATLLGLPNVAAVAELAATAPPEPLLFLPHLTGARAPLWNPAVRGGFLGLSRHHGPASLARAVLEGVALADRDLLADLPVDRVVLAGGGARSDFWCQVRADTLGVPLVRAGVDEPGLLGAAATAWVGLGHHTSLAQAQAAMARHADSFVPDWQAHARMTHLYGWFRDAQRHAIPPE